MIIPDDFPTAQQAKTAADRVKENKVQEQLDTVRRLIQQAMQRGEYHCYPRVNLLWQVEKVLKEKGFRLETETDHDIQGPTTITKIVWGQK